MEIIDLIYKFIIKKNSSDKMTFKRDYSGFMTEKNKIDNFETNP